MLLRVCRRLVAPAFSRAALAPAASSGSRCLPVRRLCASASPSAQELDAPPSAVAEALRPSFSRSARRQRLQEALAAAAEGKPFEIPEPKPQTVPGPCGAVMNVLKENRPLTSAELFAAVEEKYPGVVKSKTHLKQKIMKVALVNKVMKVRVAGADVQDRWCIKRKGQTRMRIARTLGD